MRSKALHRIYQTPLGLIVLLMAGIFIAALMSINVFAADEVKINVGNPSGYSGNVGETVNIPIQITNSSDVGGISFKISYNSSIAEHRNQGNWTWSSINQGLDPIVNDGNGFINIVIASIDGAFSSDGTIVTIPFLLKGPGHTSLSISDLGASDKTGKSLSSSGSSSSIEVTVVKTPLPQVGKPTWSGDTINWGAVANAASYRVKLYKNGSLTETVEPSGSSCDFASSMGGAGRYTVTVQALAGASETYSDGPVSSVSNERVKTEPLARVGKPTWDGNTIKWSAVANAASYRVVLNKDDKSNQTVTVNGTSHNFSERINQQGTGEYTVTVRALPGSSGLYTEGEVSVSSDANHKTDALAKPGTPSWDDDSYTISWGAVDGAASYEVILYKNGSKNDTVSASVASYNFTARINSQGPGFYTVTVRAIADPNGSYINGPVSAKSGEKIRSAVLVQVARPAWSGNNITWNSITGAVNYEIKLYKGTVPVDTRKVGGTQTSLDFSGMMKQLGAGSYSATVQALGDGELYLDGAISARASEKNYDPDKQTSEEDDKPDLSDFAVSAAPAWLPDPDGGASTGTIAWLRDDDTVQKYAVTLYRGDAQVTTITVTPGEEDELLAYDFNDQFAEPGLYYVVIEAVNEDGSSDTLESSAVMVITMETAEGSGVFQAEGFLPFAGIKMRFTSNLAVRGVFTLTRLDNSEYGVPENLQPAGIYLAVELDPELAGVTTAIEVEYDPTLLPDGLDEESLRLYRYNPEKEAWEPIESGVDTAEGHVWAELKQYSVLGVFGEVTPLEPEEVVAGGWFDISRIPYYLYPLPVIIVAALLFLLFRPRRRRRSKRRRRNPESSTYVDEKFGKPPYPLP